MKLTYRKEIDGLRAIAVLSILLFHAGFSKFSGGYVGVDVFFVISGYLISTIIFNQKTSGTFSFASFYIRRARRILPALFLVLLACLPFAWFWLIPKDMIEFAQSLLAVIFLGSNIFFWSDSGYFSTASEFRPLLHAWSLSLEEQFYLLFPLLVTALMSSKKQFFVRTCLLLGGISLIFSIWSATKYPSFGFFLLPSRIWEFLIGSLVAYFVLFGQTERPVNSTVKEYLGFAGIVLIIGAILLFKPDMPFPGYWALIPTIGTALVIAFADQNTLSGRLLGNRVFVTIGLISYSTYLWHQPIFAFARLRQLESLSTVFSFSLIVLSGTLGYLTWRYIEPIWRTDAKIRAKSFLIALIASSVTCILFSTAILYSGRTLGRMSHLPKDYFQTSWINLKFEGLEGQKCFTSEMTPCALTKYPLSTKNVLLLGDSHASDYGVIFTKYLENRSLNGSMFTVPGCAFLPSQFSNSNHCEKDYQTLTEVIKTRKFDQIILIGNYLDHTNALSETQRNSDITAFKKLANLIMDSGAEIIFLEPRLSLAYDPKKAGALKLNYKNHPVVFNADNFAAWQSVWLSLSSNPKFKRFSQDQALLEASCKSFECFNGHATDGHLLYRDINHLTNLGTQIVFDVYSEKF